MPGANRRQNRRRAVLRPPARVETMERRLLLHAGHELAAPAALTASVEATDFAAAPAAPAAILPATAPSLPDMVPLVDLAKGYVYGWEYDSKQIPGRTLLRLTTAFGNAGDGAMELRGGSVNPDGTQDVYQRIFLDDGGFSDRLAGRFIYHPRHLHTHFDDFAAYRLRPMLPGGGAGPVAAAGDKISFCLVDTDRFAPNLPRSPVLPRYTTCDTFQGISVGWGDVYDKSLADQWIDVTDVPDGRYWLEVLADPENHLLESDETNNVERVPIDLAKPSLDPFVVSHNPAGQFPAAASFIEFQFDQPMKAATFGIAEDVRSFTGSGGADLLGAITGAAWRDPATLRVSFRTQSAEGTYTLVLGPGILAADDGAPMDQDRDKVPGEPGQDAYVATFSVSTRVGPDAFGYEARAVPFEPINLAADSGGKVFTLLDGEDDAAAAVSLGSNTFDFYGTTYAGAQALYVSTNGLITFTRGFPAFANTDLSAQPALPTIAPLWDDWRTDTGDADVVLGRFDDDDGDGTPERLIVEWSNVHGYVAEMPDAGHGAGPDLTVTFQAILALNTAPGVPGAIVFNYPDLDTGDDTADGAGATVGVRGPGVPDDRRLLVARDNGLHPFVASGRALRIARPAPAAVVARHVFYNHSAWDGATVGADASDDRAIAPDKTALLPGRAATSANYTGYARGLNGVMVDVLNLPPGPVSAADFRFEGGPAPSGVAVRRGAGAGGSDRVTLVWPDGAVRNTWLRITVLATPQTGLAAADVFSFGNLVGDVGDAPAGASRATVTTLDLLATRGHVAPAAPITNRFDHNRDGRLNSLDLAVVRANLYATLPSATPTALPTPGWVSGNLFSLSRYSGRGLGWGLWYF